MTSDTVDWFMSQPDGANYVILYQMLCLKTINTAGRLSRKIGEIIIPYDIEKIARDCKWFTVDTVRVAIGLYKQFGLIYEDQDGTLVLADYSNMVGSETDYADQKRRQRALDDPKDGRDLLPDGSSAGVDNGVDNGADNVHIDIRDKRLDIPLPLQQSFTPPIVPPTVVDVMCYFRENFADMTNDAGAEAETFCAFNALYEWDILTNATGWQGAADLWAARHTQRKKGEKQ